MAIQGQRQVTGFGTDVRPKDYKKGLLYMNPNGDTPLAGLSSALKKRVVTDPQFYWWEKTLQDRRVALGANLTLINTDITVGSGALGFKAGDVLLVEQTNELVRVASDPLSDTSISVTRGHAGSTAATVDYDGNGINPNLKCIGSAFENGSSAPTGINFDPVQRTNSCQIFRSTLEMTRTAMNTELRTVSARKEARREALEVIGCDMEMAFWFGKKSSGTLNGRPIFTMDGVVNSVGTTVTADTSTGCDFAQLEAYMKAAFAYGSSEKWGFCGHTALLTIQQICRNAKGVAWDLQAKQNKFGMNINVLTCPFGTIVLKSHPLFNRMTGGTTGNADYYGADAYLAILDMKNLKYVNFTGGDLKYEEALQIPGVDGIKAGYIADCSLQVEKPDTHYLIKNLAMAKAES